MALRTRWTVRIERLQTLLAVGTLPHELAPQPVEVSLALSGLADVAPEAADDCIALQPICDWLVETWPRTPHVPLLETRINELLGHVFAQDRRVQEITVGLYKCGGPDARPALRAAAIGVERQVSRSQFESQMRMSRA